MASAAVSTSTDDTTRDTIEQVASESWLAALGVNLDRKVPSLCGREAVPGAGGFRNDPALDPLIDLATVDAFVLHPMAAGLIRQFPITALSLFQPRGEYKVDQLFQ